MILQKFTGNSSRGAARTRSLEVADSFLLLRVQRLHFLQFTQIEQHDGDSAPFVVLFPVDLRSLTVDTMLNTGELIMGNDRGALKAAAWSGHHSWSFRDTADGSKVLSGSAQQPIAATTPAVLLRYLATPARTTLSCAGRPSYFDYDHTRLDFASQLKRAARCRRRSAGGFANAQMKPNTLQVSGLCLAGA